MARVAYERGPLGHCQLKIADRGPHRVPAGALESRSNVDLGSRAIRSARRRSLSLAAAALPFCPTVEHAAAPPCLRSASSTIRCIAQELVLPWVSWRGSGARVPTLSAKPATAPPPVPACPAPTRRARPCRILDPPRAPPSASTDSPDDPLSLSNQPDAHRRRRVLLPGQQVLRLRSSAGSLSASTSLRTRAAIARTRSESA